MTPERSNIRESGSKRVAHVARIGSPQRRVRIGVEIGIHEVRDFSGLPVQLDEVGPVDLAQVGAGASFVHAKQRAEAFKCAAMDVEGVGQQFANRRLPAGFIDEVAVAGLEQNVIGQPAGF